MPRLNCAFPALPYLFAEYCSGGPRMGAEPQAERELGQLPSGEGAEFGGPLFRVPGAALGRQPGGGAPYQAGRDPGKPVGELGEEDRHEDQRDGQGDDGHRLTPQPGRGTGRAPEPPGWGESSSTVAASACAAPAAPSGISW